jgi:hypothetical protein
MERMTPEDLGVIIVLTLLVLLLSLLYDGHRGLVRWWNGVNQRKARYGQAPAPEPAQAERHDPEHAPGCANAEDERNRIAKGRNGGNDELTRNTQLRVQAEAIAALLAADSLYIPDGKGGYKKAGQTLLVKLVTGLSPNGRPGSEYGKLRAELDELMHPVLTVTDGAEVRSIPK